MVGFDAVDELTGQREGRRGRRGRRIADVGTLPSRAITVVDQRSVLTDRLRADPRRASCRRIVDGQPGRYLAAAATKACLLAAIRISSSPTRQYRRATRRDLGQVAVSQLSRQFHRRSRWASRAATIIAVGPSVTAPAILPGDVHTEERQFRIEHQVIIPFSRGRRVGVSQV